MTKEGLRRLFLETFLRGSSNHAVKNRAGKIYDFLRRCKVRAPTSCWLWPGAVSGWGYPRATFVGVQIYLHVYSYLLRGGEIPTGWVVDHVCERKRCLNPFHLRAIPESVNKKLGLRRYYNRAARAAYYRRVGHI